MKVLHIRQGIVPVIVLATISFLYVHFRTNPSLDTSAIHVLTEEGHSIALGDTLGDQSIIHFYASWCGPCMAELREMASLQSAFAEKGWQLVLLTDDPPELVEAVKRANGLQCVVLQLKSLKEIGVHTIPATLAYAFGDKKYSVVKPVDWNELLASPNSFLNE